MVLILSSRYFGRNGNGLATRNGMTGTLSMTCTWDRLGVAGCTTTRGAELLDALAGLVSMRRPATARAPATRASA